jgi:hypothetical protein
MIRGADGFGRIDARLTVKTGDSTMIYIQYLGILELTTGIVAVMRGGDTPADYDDQYFITPLGWKPARSSTHGSTTQPSSPRDGSFPARRSTTGVFRVAKS